MDRPDSNIMTMRDPANSTVISIPSRERAARSTAVVVQMPSRWEPSEQHSATVITMPTRIDCAEAHAEAKAEAEARLSHLPSAVRLTLLALFAWLGWPRPTHGKGPGAAGARPWKPSLLNLISTLHLPAASAKPRRAAAVVELPVSNAAVLDSSAVHLRAA